jgi:hypothetical protein
LAFGDRGGSLVVVDSHDFLLAHAVGATASTSKRDLRGSGEGRLDNAAKSLTSCLEAEKCTSLRVITTIVVGSNLGLHLTAVDALHDSLLHENNRVLVVRALEIAADATTKEAAQGESGASSAFSLGNATEAAVHAQFGLEGTTAALGVLLVARDVTAKSVDKWEKVSTLGHVNLDSEGIGLLGTIVTGEAAAADASGSTSTNELVGVGGVGGLLAEASVHASLHALGTSGAEAVLLRTRVSHASGTITHIIAASRHVY